MVCNDGYYEVVATHTCELCDGCATCETSPTNCLSCSGSTYLNAASCPTECPTGTYANNLNNVCTTCNPACTICTGPNLNQCTGCKTDGSDNYF